MIPEGPHRDWPWPLSYIPRRWTAWESTKLPVKLLGTVGEDEHLDIPKPGKWVLAWPLYFAITTKNLFHFRVGLARYDFVDHYYQIGTITLKRLKRH